MVRFGGGYRGITMTAALGTADAQVARVLELVGVHSHAINALLTVSTVEWSDATATACVNIISI